MPVYNAEKTVDAALASLRGQSFGPLEIIVVNDGSTDRTLGRLHRTPGIKVLDHSHRGIAAALNDGLAAARGDYIARMDADDVCHPERIEQQVSYLDAFPDMGVVGCRVAFGGDPAGQAGYGAYVDWINTLVDPDQIALNRFIESPFAHPSTLFRRTLPERYGAYRDGPFPEDYELWMRWMANGVKMGKVDKELVTWNDPPGRLSRTDERYHIDSFYQVKAEYLHLWLKENNPHHPDIIVWGAGRVTRRRAEMLSRTGVRITHYIDIKSRRPGCGTPVLRPAEIPDPETCFVLSMVGNRGARDQIRPLLAERGFTEGKNCLFAA
jgi:glycosyltransferase involved in cell wall biosynthesis